MDITFDKNATCLCKGIAICLMIYYHLFGATDLSMFQVVLPPVFGILGPYGNVCVMFFVLLTGYGFGIRHISRPESYPRQILPRLLRLYQGYLPAFLIGLFGSLLLSQGKADPLTVYGSAPAEFLRHLLLNLLGLSHLVYGDGLYTLNQTWWYMSLALILILILPLLCRLYRRWGWDCFFITLVFSVFPSEPRLFSYLHYLPGAALGLCLAGGNGFAQVARRSRCPLGIFLHFPALFFCLLLWYRMRQAGIFPLLADLLAAYAGCQFAFDVLRPIPVLSHGLIFLGTHSGNLFYLHSFIYCYWILPGRFVFRFRYDLLIFLVTLLLTLGLSLTLNAVKGAAGYDRFFARMEKRILSVLPNPPIHG